MGSSSSRTARRPPPLSERDACAIALAWRDELRGCVRLETEDAASAPHCLIPTFEWVTFVFNGTLKNGFHEVTDAPTLAGFARAATIAWFTLACCEGYSGRENPVFWKRVFLELLYPAGFRTDLQEDEYQPTHPQLPITDATRFFDREDTGFPRIKLVVGDTSDASVIQRVFFGQLVYADSKRDRHLKRVLKQLQSHFRPELSARVVSVMIDELPLSQAASVLENATKCLNIQIPESAYGSQPRMQLQSVALCDTKQFSVLDDLPDQLPGSDVEVKLAVGLWNIVQDRRLCRCLLRSNDQSVVLRTRVESLFVGQTTDLSYSFVGILCSALPQNRSIKGITLPSARYYAYGAPSSPASDWAWLGYAIFHPDAASQSEFSSLSVQLKGTTSQDLKELGNMASGNHLLGDNAACASTSSYIEGRVRSSASAWSEPRDDEPPLHTFQFETWVSLCVASADVPKSQTWVASVIPGFGLAWIRHEDIIQTRSRPPGRSCIRALRVTDLHDSEDEKKLTSLLSISGDTLETLDIAYSRAVSCSTVVDIVRHCPKLKRLRIPHDGAVWARDDVPSSSSCLEKLELKLGGWPVPEPMTLQPLRTSCLPHLKTLRVLSYHAHSFEQDEDIMSILREHRGLQYFHWTRGHDLTPSWCGQSYDELHEQTRRFERQLQREGIHVYYRPLTSECRLAFLSVVRHRKWNFDGRHLGEDVIALIFASAASPSKRQVYIEPMPPRARDHP